MPAHHERRVLPYTQTQMFDLVAAIECYPEFLPWCVATRIVAREEKAVLADLVIGFKMVRESFTSRARFDRPARIDIEYLSGPLKHLRNQWQFRPLVAGGSEIDFFIDFEFRSRLMRGLMGAMFHEALRRMVGAFETRAHVVYGPVAAGSAPLAELSQKQV
ncbi:MAG: type II toxin-antitoxin system RatA family toxin [Alphaproteobacteria bacterium]|nr:type II toxin-antitoxin system RatA family toxin [Alphaproteobacteria bacterium]